QSVIPSSACGTGSPWRDSKRKKWQYLWIVLPRNRKYQSITWIGPCRMRSSSPVSSSTSRRAASAGGSPRSRCPFGKPQFLYESRINRNRGGPPSGGGARRRVGEGEATRSGAVGGAGDARVGGGEPSPRAFRFVRRGLQRVVEGLGGGAEVRAGGGGIVEDGRELALEGEEHTSEHQSLL